jgi:peroxiredoxin
MSSQEPEGRPVESERGLITNKYVLIMAIVLAAIALINSIFLNQPKIVQATDFSLTTTAGEKFSLSSSRGKVVIINFMATSCPYCISEMADLKKVWDAYGGKVVMISISVDPFSDTDDILRGFASSYGANWLFARDVAGVTAYYGVTGTPTTVIIDQSGNIQYRHVGYTEASTFLNDLVELLKG